MFIITVHGLFCYCVYVRVYYILSSPGVNLANESWTWYLPHKFVVVVLLARRRLRLTSARNAAVTATRRVESVTAARSRDATISRWSSAHYAAHRATTTDSFCAKHAPPTITTLPTFSCCQCAAPVSVFWKLTLVRLSTAALVKHGARCGVGQKIDWVGYHNAIGPSKIELCIWYF